MSTTRGIFESFPNQPANRADSPFAVVQEPAPAPAAAASPFTAGARQDSPFTVVADGAESRVVEPGRPARVPERRRAESPFQVAEPPEGFGFEAPAKSYAAAPFEVASAAVPVLTSPFATPAPPVAASPFSVEPPRGASLSTQAAIAAFGNWDAPTAPADVAIPQAFAQPTPAAFAPAPAPAVQIPAAFAPLVAPVEDSNSDSFAIRQIELRAIFGVDREMNPEEILQRTRALPGMRNVARVNPQDMATIEAVKTLLPNLGFGSGSLKLYSGSVPLEFIREGPVMLAVQTDGGFAPGVRETLMLVARELGKA